MGFCSYSKEFSASSYTNVENQFITKYMVLADGDAVKVYLYGLYLCQNVQEEFTLTEAARDLNMSEKQIMDLFRFWEDFDLLQIVSIEPFCVKYFPSDYSKGKPKKIRTEKYSDFNKAVQSLMPQKMISTSEFEKYFAVMEQYSIKPEAMILIVKYCIDLKGETIAQNYILQVARNFAYEGVTTVEKIEKETFRLRFEKRRYRTHPARDGFDEKARTGRLQPFETLDRRTPLRNGYGGIRRVAL